MNYTKIFFPLFFFLNVLYAGSCGPHERLFQHKLLATPAVCVPNNPQRVVALDMGAAELTLLSGKELSGTANWLLAEMSVVSPEFRSILPSVTNVGYPASLEKIAVIKPDLILAVGTGKGLQKSIDVAGAQKIAPVIMANPRVYDDWKISAEFWAHALNETILYKRLLGNYQARVDELKIALGDSLNETVSLVGNSSYGKSLWLKDTPPAAVLKDIGFLRPQSQDYDRNTATLVYKDARYPMISDEKLQLADADNIFIFSYPSTKTDSQKQIRQATKAIKNDVLWQSLNAAKNGKLFVVGGHWWRSNSYLLANKVLDDIAEKVIGKKPQTASLNYPITQQ